MKTDSRRMNPKISVAITTYDRTNLLKDAVLSVLNQSYENFEILVGNDNVDRDIQGIFRDLIDPRLILINNAKNLGYIENYNNLLSLARGEFFVALSDDDLFHPNFLEIMLNIIDKENAICSFSNYQSDDEFFIKRIAEQSLYKSMNGRSWVLGYLKKEYKALGCCGIMRTEFLRKIGGSSVLGSDWTFSPYNDNLLALQAVELTKILYCETPLIYYRLHNLSYSTSSNNVHAYRTAQEDFIKIITPYFDRCLCQNEKKIVLDYLLAWFLDDFFSLLNRSNSPYIKELQCHFIMYISNHFYKKNLVLGLFEYTYNFIYKVLRPKTKTAVKKLIGRLH